MTLRYVEALPDEDWRSLSEAFATWAKPRMPPGNWGYSEGAPTQVDDRRFLGFSIPARHIALTELFIEWAALTNRLVGTVDGALVVFPGEPGLSADLPASERDNPAPPWLR